VFGMLSFAWFLERQGTTQGTSPSPCSRERLRYRKETEWLKVAEHMGVGLSFSPAYLCLGLWVAYSRLPGRVKDLLIQN